MDPMGKIMSDNVLNWAARVFFCVHVKYAGLGKFEEDFSKVMVYMWGNHLRHHFIQPFPAELTQLTWVCLKMVVYPPYIP